MRRSTIGPAGAALAILAALGSTGLSAQDTGGVSGTVTDAMTGQPLSGVQVSIAGTGFGSLSRGNGVYAVQGVPAGAQTVEFRLIGYATESVNITVSAGQVTTADAALSEEVIVLGGISAIGTRARPRTVTESAVPIDVLPSAEIVKQGDTDMANLLRNVAPSFNVNIQPISDAATFARPANLRGLAPDHTLVLVNGKRRHRTAVITWYGNGLADGSQGPDLSVIPGTAVEQAEILRDGAAAQYGSDAIAGVMNFILKNDRSGGSLEVKSGGYLTEGDGEMYSITGNVGLPLGDNGFLNLTGEYGNSGTTNRAVQRNDALALIAAGNTSVREPAQIWGSPDIKDEIKLWANTGYVFQNGTSFYGNGSYVSKTVEGGFYFRNPNTRSGVFGTGDEMGSKLLVGDLLDAQDGVLDGSAGCPRVAVSGGVVTDLPAWQEVLANPNCFTFQKLFPGGFTPQFGSEILDASGVAGLKGILENGLNWDLSVGWGRSNMDFFMYNTVNASLGPNQPCSDEGTSPHVPEQPCTPFFRPGIYDQQELNLNLDLSYALNDRVNVAGGLERRTESFEIIQGDEASWTEGPLASQGFTPGSNGFTGFGPLTVGNWSRTNYAGYTDLEVRDPDGGWTVGLAGRAENFSDFGTTVNGKLSSRVRLTEGFALRGSASTGFRAPTPGQSNAFNISTIYDFDLGDLTNNGTIPSTSLLAARYGGEALDPETSVSVAIGGVAESGNFNLSVDAYQINMSNRLTFSQDFLLSPDEIETLLAEGIIRPGGVLARFRFFINDFDTRSQGIDIVAAYRMVGDDLSGTTISSAWNFNRTEVTKWNANTLNALRIRRLEEGLPNVRGNVTVQHDLAGGAAVLVRSSYWGGYFDGETPYYESGSSNTIDYPARTLLDVEASYPLTESFRLTLGGQNVLNTFPQEYPGAADGVGNRYGQFTPFGFNGGFYYARVGYHW